MLEIYYYNGFLMIFLREKTNTRENKSMVKFDLFKKKLNKISETAFLGHTLKTISTFIFLVHDHSF